jgi:hypothetical protein
LNGVVFVELAQSVFDVFQSHLLASKAREPYSKSNKDMVLHLAKDHRRLYLLLNLGAALIPKDKSNPLDGSLSKFSEIILVTVWQAATLHQITSTLPCEKGAYIEDTLDHAVTIPESFQSVRFDDVRGRPAQRRNNFSLNVLVTVETHSLVSSGEDNSSLLASSSKQMLETWA